MPKSKSKAPAVSAWDSAISILTWLATCISIFSFLFLYKNGEILLYGDAVAHINIARRVFDSKTPGLLQLGTVWLPLPHLLMIPFLIPDKMWISGAGGSLPSMVAYVFAVIGMFRLVRGALSRALPPEPPARVAAWIAAIVFAANPNLIYMQATAMGEAIYLAFFIWSVVYLSEFVGGEGSALTKCGLCLVAACLTRYDGWFLAAAIVATVLILTVTRAKSSGTTGSRSRFHLAKFVLLSAAAPALWLAYNGIVYRNPLEFENGPYSAKAIEHNAQAHGSPGHPGSGNLLVAGMYFVKAAETNMAASQGLQRFWIFLICAAVLSLAVIPRATRVLPKALELWPLSFLLLPLPFYGLSIAYGGVPIFVPEWWPFAHYNVRYGLELLPAFSVAVAVVVYFLLGFENSSPKLTPAALLVILGLGVASYVSVWSASPVCLEEAQINMRTRNQLERQVAELLKRLPPDSTLLMYLGDHVGALEQADIPLHRVINEGNHRVWKQPSDPDGLWEHALANPAQYADYVVAFEEDPVWRAVQQQHLHELVEIHVTGQPRGVLYRAR